MTISDFSRRKDSSHYQNGRGGKSSTLSTPHIIEIEEEVPTWKKEKRRVAFRLQSKTPKEGPSFSYPRRGGYRDLLHYIIRKGENPCREPAAFPNSLVYNSQVYAMGKLEKGEKSRKRKKKSRVHLQKKNPLPGKYSLKFYPFHRTRKTQWRKSRAVQQVPNTGRACPVLLREKKVSDEGNRFTSMKKGPSGKTERLCCGEKGEGR